jgi:hypothetical protein
MYNEAVSSGIVMLDPPPVSDVWKGGAFLEERVWRKSVRTAKVRDFIKAWRCRVAVWRSLQCPRVRKRCISECPLMKAKGRRGPSTRCNSNQGLCICRPGEKRKTMPGAEG